MSDTNTERRNAAPSLRIRTNLGDLDLNRIREHLTTRQEFDARLGLGVDVDTAISLALLDALEAALSVPAEPYEAGRRGDVASGANDMRGRIYRAAGVISDDAPESPEWLTRDQALEAARHAYPEHGELHVVSWLPITVEDGPMWEIVVSNGKHETIVAYPRMLEETN